MELTPSTIFGMTLTAAVLLLAAAVSLLALFAYAGNLWHLRKFITRWPLTVSMVLMGYSVTIVLLLPAMAIIAIWPIPENAPQSAVTAAIAFLSLGAAYTFLFTAFLILAAIAQLMAVRRRKV